MSEESHKNLTETSQLEPAAWEFELNSGFTYVNDSEKHTESTERNREPLVRLSDVIEFLRHHRKHVSATVIQELEEFTQKTEDNT